MQRFLLVRGDLSTVRLIKIGGADLRSITRPMHSRNVTRSSYNLAFGRCIIVDCRMPGGDGKLSSNSPSRLRGFNLYHNAAV